MKNNTPVEIRYKEKLESLYKFNEILLNNSPTAIAVLNADMSIKYVNPAFTELTGFGYDEVIGLKAPFPWWEKKELKKTIKLFKDLKTRKRTKDEIVYRSKSGKRLDVIVSSIFFKEKNEIKYLIANIIDITEEKQRNKKLEYVSFHDSLTGAYNRAYFNEEIKRLSKSRLYPVSIIIGDLNNLKLINDIFGHAVGDLLLKKIAKIIKKSCRAEDIVSRWGGDEFSIILPKTDHDVAKKVIFRIKEISSNTTIKNLPISISLGSATITNERESISSKIKEAENNMYDAKLHESGLVANQIIREIEKLLISKNIENESHLSRLLEVAKKTSAIFNFKRNEIDNLEYLCRFHDLGKITIPESVIMKAGKLAQKELKMIEKNPIIGSRIASSSPGTAHISELILSHYERWDGTGYPRGLKGQEIPFLARLFSIINSYVTMTSPDISYKKPKSKTEAIEELKKCAGTQFDPKLVKEFISIL